jgi:pimeloyl-ACP methyl ester carboxylesterase
MHRQRRNIFETIRRGKADNTKATAAIAQASPKNTKAPNGAVPTPSKTPPTRVGVLIVHGINTAEVGYSEAFRAKLKIKLQLLGLSDPNDVSFEEVFWAYNTKSNQSEFKLNKTIYTEHMNREPIRSFIIEALGDAAAYQNVRPLTYTDSDDCGLSSHSPTTYENIQEELDRSIENLAAKLDPDSPIIIVAHSFGGWVVHRYIMDIQKYKALSAPTAPAQVREQKTAAQGETPDHLATLDARERARATALSEITGPTRSIRLMETLSGVITIGCNLPIFAFSLDPRQARPFEFASAARARAEGSTHSHGRRLWLNFYNRHDVLSFPLRSISKSFEDVVHDHEVSNKGARTFFATLHPWAGGIVGTSIALALLAGFAFVQGWTFLGLPSAGLNILFGALLGIVALELVVVGAIWYFSDRLDFVGPHGFYWEDKQVINAAAGMIEELAIERAPNAGTSHNSDLDELKIKPPVRQTLKLKSQDAAANDLNGGPPGKQPSTLPVDPRTPAPDAAAAGV